jgi:type III pantothenate kinase
MFAIDCGNSRIKWARFVGARAHDRGAASLRDDDAFAVLGGALGGGQGDGHGGGQGDGAARVVVANVAGEAIAGRIRAVVVERLGIEPEFARVEARAHGIECAYRDPATLGVDRWLAMVAARRQGDGPFAVVGAGTAVTFDAVDAAGRHLGGLILPGDRLMIEALAANTGRIPSVPPAGDFIPGLALLGRSTAEAVGHGARLAIAAAIDRALALVAAALEAEPTLLLTGGDAEALAGWLASKGEVRADLVLDGLAVIAAAPE